MSVGVNSGQQSRLQERTAQPDLQQINRAPEHAQSDCNCNARLEEPPVDEVRKRLLIAIVAGGTLYFRIKFAQQLSKIDLMDVGKERQRLSRTLLAAASVQSMLVEDAPCARTLSYNFCNRAISSNDFHQRSPHELEGTQKEMPRR
jgi:hypothetical protein